MIFDQIDVHLAESLLTGPQVVKCCSGGHLTSLGASLQMISFVHALGESKIVHTGHQGLWRSTEAVINAVLDWRHILANPHLPGISAISATSSQMSLELVLTLAMPTLTSVQQWPCLRAYWPLNTYITFRTWHVRCECADRKIAQLAPQMAEHAFCKIRQLETVLQERSK